MAVNFIDLDQFDRKIIEALRRDAAITVQGLASHIQLSTSATNERLRRLRERGVIKRIVAFVDAKAVGRELCAFISVLIDSASNNANFLREIAGHPAVAECHHVTGSYSYLLKVRVKNTAELESFITDFLKQSAGVSRSLTQIVLSSPKEGDTILQL